MLPFSDLLRELAATQARFVVVGGVAAVMHGVERITFDLDLVVELTPPATLAVVEKLVALGFKARVPADPRGFADPAQRERWIVEKGMMVFSFWDTHEERPNVDLFVRYPLDFERLWTRARVVDVDGAEIRIAAPQHLAAMKRAAGRDKDIADIRAMGLDPEAPDDV